MATFNLKKKRFFVNWFYHCSSFSRSYNFDSESKRKDECRCEPLQLLVRWIQ